MSAQPGDDGGQYHLLRLQNELAKRCLKSEVDTRGVVPRLRIFRQGVPHDSVAEFENSVVAPCFGQDLWFAWPWAEPIARAGEVARAADEIADALGPDGR